MAKLTKQARLERDDAIAQLKEWIKPGDTVYTILDHVSSSGMSRAIRVVIPRIKYAYDTEGVDPLAVVQGQPAGVEFSHPNYAVGKALGLKHWKRNGQEQDALVLSGGGMDMGFHLVYELSATLYGGKADGTGGYQCLGKGKCPSNYHVNHRDLIRCEGTHQHNNDGPNTGYFCHHPNIDGAGYCVPVDRVVPGVTCLLFDADGDAFTVCPQCKGEGYLPNPDGPERFDLVHVDGYALRHRWL